MERVRWPSIFRATMSFTPSFPCPRRSRVPYELRWSRSPGCYQLKSALAWREVEDDGGTKLFESVLAHSLATHESFLTAEPDRERQMDRLHAYCYFLEGLLPAVERVEVRDTLASGLARAAALYRVISPVFERSDVAAQLLRVRLIAHHLDAVACWMSVQRARKLRAPRLFKPWLITRTSASAAASSSARRTAALLPFSNPVSTAFCLQALDLWRQHREGRWSFDLQQLI